MRIVTNYSTLYDHETTTATRTIDNKIAKINLASKLPITYDNMDDLTKLNAIANTNLEDFKALAYFQEITK